MQNAKFTCSALVAAGLFAGTAHASLVVGAPVIVPTDMTQATVTFTGSDAGYTGQLRFLGSGLTISTLDAPAPDTDLPGLGELLFNNHTSAIDSVMVLPGLFSAGDVLHFAYTIIAPSSVAGLTFRTDTPSHAAQFAHDASTGALGVEDLLLPGGDHDYNDATFQVTFTQVPAPGSLVLLSAAGLCAARRRRVN